MVTLVGLAPDSSDRHLEGDGPVLFVSHTAAWDPEAIRRFFATLSREERGRAASVRDVRSRASYVLAHGLLRLLLARVARTAPSEIAIDVERNRRPWVRFPPDLRPVTVSLSHTLGVVAVALSIENLVGVDVEEIKPEASDSEVARSVFSQREYQEWIRCTGESRSAEFFRLWTLKEAVLKAAGIGLAVNPAEVDTSLDPTPHLRAIPRRLGRPDAWTLRSFVLETHCCSIAHAVPDRGQLIPLRTLDRTILNSREPS